jgi:protein TonB
VPLFKEALPGDVLTAAMDGKGHLDRAAFQSAHPDRKFLESLPRLVSQVPAEYPEEAQRRKIEGMVVLSVLVGTRGEVDSVRVVRSVGLLDEAAVASAWRWKFEPAISLGEPVAEWIVVPVSFRLER